MYKLELHNLNMEGKLRSIANPLSNMRFEAILETTLVKTAKAGDDLAESLAVAYAGFF